MLRKLNAKPRKGSITVYLALILLVMISLITASIRSVKISAGRMQAANSMDQAMYSLFARYDQQLEDTYGLFFLNTGSGDGGPNLGVCVKEIEDAAAYILKPNKGRSVLGGKNLVALKAGDCAVTGYSLATDAGGAAFCAEASQYVKETYGITSISRLKERVQEAKGKQKEGKDILSSSNKTNYGQMEQEANAARRKREEARREAEENGTPMPPEEPQVPADFVNPVPFLKDLKEKAVLDIVAPDGVSEKTAETGSLVSGRSLAQGFGTIDTDTGGSKVYFKAYVLEHYSTYDIPSEHSQLAYQMEYILCGKDSDLANMKEVVKRLMRIREADNIACIYANPGLSQSLEKTSDLIALSLGLPALGPAVKLVLAGLWSYAESVVDIRALFLDKKVSLVKRESYWQTDLDSLFTMSTDLDGMTRDDPLGLSYKEYLGILLLESHSDLVRRAMDMTESEIRGNGQPDFRLDHCIYSLEAEMEVEAEKTVTFPVKKALSYKDL